MKITNVSSYLLYQHNEPMPKPKKKAKKETPKSSLDTVHISPQAKRLFNEGK